MYTSDSCIGSIIGGIFDGVNLNDFVEQYTHIVCAKDSSDPLPVRNKSLTVRTGRKEGCGHFAIYQLANTKILANQIH